MRAIALLIIALLAVIALAASEHSRLNSGLPLVRATWRPPSPEDSRLFANCPITPWALPTHSKEHIV